jgi:hypothetical protein
MTTSPRTLSFDTPGPIHLRVDLPAGRILVDATDTKVTTVELAAIHGDSRALQWIADAQIEQRGDEIVVRILQPWIGMIGMGGAIAATIRAPADSALNLRTGSAHIEAIGRFGEVKAMTGSGDVRLGEVGDADVRTGSGDIAIESAVGHLEAHSGSGNVSIGKLGGEGRVNTGSGNVGIDRVEGDARVNSGSGNIHVAQAGESLHAFSASGRVVVSRADHGRVRAKTVSGKVSVGVANGAAAWLDISSVSGRVNSQLENTSEPASGDRKVELRITTGSGNVEVQRA